MKRYLHVILAGVIGGVVAVAGYKWMDDPTQLVSESIGPQAVFTSFNSSPSMNIPGDFVESARKSTGSVVHIYAEESDELAMQKRRSQQRNDPFFNFFGLEDFFGGGNFYTPKNGTGSGVIYSESGYVITNNHVVGFADRITITDAEGKKYKATKVGADAASDLAVLKIEGGKGFVPVKWGDSDKVQVGEWVLAVGNPFGYLTSTVTAGIVSAKGRSLNLIQNEKAIEEFIQTDAAINPGNSGGALVNLQGELIGINTAIATPTGVFAGYSFAIPAKIVKKVVASIIENGGKVERTNLGVAGYDVNADLVEEFGLKLRDKRGFYIEEVEKRSPAQMGGILPGDVIIEIDGKSIQNYEDIEKAMKYNIVGDKLSVKVNRTGKEIDIPIALRKSF
jgi:S1-C subfamily serine protease